MRNGNNITVHVTKRERTLWRCWLGWVAFGWMDINNDEFQIRDIHTVDVVERASRTYTKTNPWFFIFFIFSNNINFILMIYVRQNNYCSEFNTYFWMLNWMLNLVDYFFTHSTGAIRVLFRQSTSLFFHQWIFFSKFWECLKTMHESFVSKICLNLSWSI